MTTNQDAMSDKVAEQNWKMFPSKAEQIEHCTFGKELKDQNGAHAKEMALSRPHAQQLSTDNAMATRHIVNTKKYIKIHTKLNFF